MSENLPGFLAEACAQAQHCLPEEGFDALTAAWEAFVEMTCRTIPEVHYDDNTCLLALGEISPGCTACRMGKWDCLFVTHRCNLNCPFCYSPQVADDSFCGSNLGRNPLEGAVSYARLGIDAVSFTGGEALLEKERLLDWLTDVQTLEGIQYRWLYSNGLLLDESTLDALAAGGLDEIRINAAASGYVHPHVLAMISAAVERLPLVTVEIPILPDDREKLLAALPVWQAHGVGGINLHELLYEPGSNAARLKGERQRVQLPDGHVTWIDPRCHSVALAVFQKVQADGLPLAVNYCGTVGKWRQLTARREAVLQCVPPEPHEQYVGGGVLESYYCLHQDEVQSCHPALLGRIRRELPSARFFHLRRMAPLSPGEHRKHWISFAEISGVQA